MGLVVSGSVAYSHSYCGFVCAVLLQYTLIRLTRAVRAVNIFKIFSELFINLSLIAWKYGEMGRYTTSHVTLGHSKVGN